MAGLGAGGGPPRGVNPWHERGFWRRPAPGGDVQDGAAVRTDWTSFGPILGLTAIVTLFGLFPEWPLVLSQRGPVRAWQRVKIGAFPRCGTTERPP